MNKKELDARLAELDVEADALREQRHRVLADYADEQHANLTDMYRALKAALDDALDALKDASVAANHAGDASYRAWATEADRADTDPASDHERLYLQARAYESTLEEYSEHLQHLWSLSNPAELADS